VKRRALLLLGALLMPTAARAKTTKQKQTRPAAKKPVAAAAPAKPVGLQPVKEAKTQLIAFNASAFP
jgi:hypothetical protein